MNPIIAGELIIIAFFLGAIFGTVRTSRVWKKAFDDVRKGLESIAQKVGK